VIPARARFARKSRALFAARAPLPFLGWLEREGISAPLVLAVAKKMAITAESTRADKSGSEVRARAHERSLSFAWLCSSGRRNVFSDVIYRRHLIGVEQTPSVHIDYGLAGASQ